MMKIIRVIAHSRILLSPFLPLRFDLLIKTRGKMQGGGEDLSRSKL